MNGFPLSLDDVVHHVVSIGLDVYPPIEMKDERTRLHMFFEDVRERCSFLYERLTAGESEFKISKSFRKDPPGSRPGDSRRYVRTNPARPGIRVSASIA